MKKLLILLTILYLLTSCTVRDIVYVPDPLFVISLEDHDLFARELIFHGEFFGAFINYRAYDQLENSELIAAQLHSEDMIITTHWFYENHISGAERDAPVLLLNGPEVTNDDNVRSLRHDRSPAFTDLGRLFAEYMEDNDIQNSAGIFLTDNEAAQQELQSFLDGFRTVVDESRVRIFESASIDNRRQATGLAERVRSNGYQLCAVFTGRWNAEILPILNSSEILFATEYIQAAGYFTDLCVYSLEHNYLNYAQQIVHIIMNNEDDYTVHPRIVSYPAPTAEDSEEEGDDEE
ncbi:MAG: hypothetical protein ACLFR1_10645 [Spirochaetia bacterium]